MLNWLARLVLVMSVLCIGFGVLTAPVREAKADTWIACHVRVPANLDFCDGSCWEIIHGSGAWCDIRLARPGRNECYCTQRPNPYATSQ
jgi:hypothetical protein